jgi:hypothetical protein
MQSIFLFVGEKLHYERFSRYKETPKCLCANGFVYCTTTIFDLLVWSASWGYLPQKYQFAVK